MSQEVKINFETEQVDRNGVPYRNISKEQIDELGIKTEKELSDRKTEFPAVTLADILDIMFDVVPLPSNKLFALYNNVLIDIMKTKKTKVKTVSMEKLDLENFKKLFEKGIDGKPELNRKCGFVYKCLENALASHTIGTP